MHAPRHTSFFFNDTATTEIYTLSLHDALPISLEDCQHQKGFRTPVLEGHQQKPRRGVCRRLASPEHECIEPRHESKAREARDRKSTRLNSSHSQISYAVFCLKKKTNDIDVTIY